MENGAGKLQLFSQVLSIDQGAVVSNCQRSLDMAHQQRLGVETVGHPVTGVANMTDGHFPFAERIEAIVVEHLMNQTDILVRGKDTAVINGDAATLLTTMLQCIESVISAICYIGFRRTIVDTKKSTFFMNCHIAKTCLFNG